MMQTITPFLWFDDQAEEAAHFYTSVFPSSSILDVTRYGEGAPQAGTAMVVTFVLDGLELHALNGGPGLPFTEAVSLYVTAETQDEIDELWTRLTDGGEPARSATAPRARLQLAGAPHVAHRDPAERDREPEGQQAEEHDHRGRHAGIDACRGETTTDERHLDHPDPAGGRDDRPGR